MNKAITVSTITVYFFILLIAGCAAPHRSVEHSPYAGMARSSPPNVAQTGPAVAESNKLKTSRPEPAGTRTDKSVSASGLTTQETIATTGLAPTTTSAPQTGPQELRGKVIRVDDRLVRIVMESEMWPRVGDTVRLGQSMPGWDELVFMPGEWTVTEVTSKYIQAEAGAGASGTPGRNYVAVIRSANPQKNAGLAPVEKVSGKKADERFDLAQKLWKGRNISQDRKKSLQLIQQGAREGHPVSMRALGWIYERGEGGIAQDYAIAVKWYRKAADAGDPNAYNLLGAMYRKGKGVKQDYHRAVELYEKACNDGNAPGCTNLGYMYSIGKGVTQNYRRAAELYEKACTGGNASGCANLGNRYKTGEGVKQDSHRAAELYEKACTMGHEGACKNLDEMKVGATPPRSGYEEQMQQEEEAKRQEAAGELLPGLIELRNQMIRQQNKKR